MIIRWKKTAYTILTLVLCLCLAGSFAAGAAGAAELPSATVAPEKNGMYDLLSEVFDRYHAGTAGCSLIAAYLAANIVDWACANGQTAARAAALGWDRGAETEFGELFSEKMEAMYSSALQICRGGEGVLADCGYQGIWTHTEAEVRETFDNLFQGLGFDVPAELRSSAASDRGSGAVTVDFEREAEEIYTDDGKTLLLNYACAAPIVSIPGNETAAFAINAALETERSLFADGPELPAEGVFSGKEMFLQSARENYVMREKDGYLEYFAPYALLREADVARTDDKVLSVTFDDTTYMGGAHGWTGRTGYVFDVRTGARLTLEDLTDDPAGFRSALLESLTRQINSAEYAMYGVYDDYMDYLPGLIRESNWYLGSEGLVILANPYEIAPYAAGRIDFTLPYSWLRWYVKEEYLPSDAETLGTLEGEITGGPVESTFFVSDGEEIASTILMTARGRVENITVRRVSMSWDNFSYYPGELLWSGSVMEDGETLVIRNQIPDVCATLSLTYTGLEGEQTFYLFQSGKDGSLVLMNGLDYAYLPLEISGLLPFSRDIDGDGAWETIDLRQIGTNGSSRWQLIVDGQPVIQQGYAMSSYLLKLWVCDLDYDGVCEIFYSGDLGSDDFITCGWHGNTLEPILFDAGDGLSETMDGELVFSVGNPVIRGWIYQMGTYAASRVCEYADGVLTPAAYSEWNYRGNTTVLTLKRDLPVTFDYSGTGTEYLPAGSTITLRSTTGSDTRFVTPEGRTGTISLEYRRDGFDSGWFIDGVSENEYFVMLPYAG